MRNPNLKPTQDEQPDPSQERVDGNVIDAEGGTGQTTHAQEGQDEYDDPAENLLNAPDSSRKGNHVETP